MRQMIYAAFLLSALCAALLFSSPVHAFNLTTSCESQNAGQCNIIKQNDLDYRDSNNRIWNITKVAMGLLAGISVIMIIIGGIKYVTSQGESAAVGSAKNTILYAVIGLIVAILASTIVAFVTNQFG